MVTEPGAPDRHQTAGALLAATRRLLVREGQSGVTTRRVAEEAGQAHGLVRYHFGSLEGLMLRTLEQATGEIIGRQQALYDSDAPFHEKWDTAMAYVESDLDDGYPKLLGELLALAWNDPAYRDGMRRISVAFTDMLATAVDAARTEYGRDDVDVTALATLIRTFQLGMLVERLAGIDVGHAELLQSIDHWLSEQDERARGTVPTT
jgi:AcrR family transcriptional regulator